MCGASACMCARVRGCVRTFVRVAYMLKNNLQCILCRRHSCVSALSVYACACLHVCFLNVCMCARVLACVCLCICMCACVCARVCECVLACSCACSALAFEIYPLGGSYVTILV